MTNDDSLNDFYDWTYGTGAYDDNAGANPANANATAPIITTGNQSNISSGWLGLLQTAIGTAGTAYGATQTADANLRNQQRITQRTSKNSNLLIYLGIGGALLLGAVLVFRRK